MPEIPCVRKLKLKWTMQEDNDFKHSSKSSKEEFKIKMNVLEWESQNPDINSIEDGNVVVIAVAF